MLASLRTLSQKRVSSTILSSLPELPRPPLPSLTTSLSHFHCPTTEVRRPRPSIICSPSRLQLKNHGRRSASSTSASSITFPYLSVSIRCGKDIADMLSEALLCFGASSVSMYEAESCENIDEICINSIFMEGQDVGTCISHAANSIGLNKMPSYEVVIGEQCDWVKNSLDVQAKNIILNPGLAFGTGEHPTTKLCLLLLHGLIRGGEYFLDYGTGSGILGIAALKMGAALSVGVDTDPQAITSARQNAALNNIEPEKMQLYLASSNVSPLLPNGTVTRDVEGLSSYSLEIMGEMENFDVVIANILLNPLIELADYIVAYAKPGAVIGVSGIMSEQIPQIEKRYSQHLNSLSVSEMDGWACVSGIKKQKKVEKSSS
ncbi:uncharacterized protein LOC131221206 isoform X2 [Magnolia sinica]|uniref:uncharacterized protein LOC131221206 isoform X2 n=1 Tax=Magnolia sinica TaxID=86752 RepID=UPI002657B676|nr:uncharacterized protein LOC131221206 isoform X2 [Magnolia sinica]